MQTKEKGWQPTAWAFLALFLFSIGLMFFPPTLSLGRGGGGGSSGGGSSGGCSGKNCNNQIQFKKLRVRIGAYKDEYESTQSSYINGIWRPEFQTNYKQLTFESEPAQGSLTMNCGYSSMFIVVSADGYYKKNYISQAMATEFYGNYVEIDVPSNRSYNISARLVHKAFQNLKLEKCQNNGSYFSGRQEFEEPSLSPAPSTESITLLPKVLTEHCYTPCYPAF